MMTVVAVDESERSQIANAIETALLASLARSNTQAENDSFVLVHKGQSSALTGGVTGSTSYGWPADKNALGLMRCIAVVVWGNNWFWLLEGRARENRVS